MRYLAIFLFVALLIPDTNPGRVPERVRMDLDHSNRYSQFSSAQSEEELVEFIESVMESYMIPGASLAIVKDGAIAWEKTFGFADIDDGIEVGPGTMFILSSVSKTVTATALMQLFENGLFELDDAINPYLPFNVNHPDYPFAPITFKMLLSHTSGIKDNWGVMDYYDGDSTYELEYYLGEYLVPGGQFYASNSNFTNSAPGTSYRYSNIGAALIGLLVEQISGQPFNQYCSEYIFEPLGMDNSFWFLSEIDDMSQVAMPYGISGGSGSTCYEIGCGVYDDSNPCFCDSACVDYNDCCPDYDEVCGEDGTGGNELSFAELYHYGYSDYPSGQLRSSAHDMARFMAMYMGGGIYNGQRVLDESTIELIKETHFPGIDSNQGLIWYYKNLDGRTLFGHNGGDLGSLTEMFISLSEGIGVIVLTNTSEYYGAIQIENALFDFAESASFSAPGDINQDGVLSILDVIILINIVLDGGYDTLADINSDGSIDILDVVQLVGIILS